MNTSRSPKYTTECQCETLVMHNINKQQKEKGLFSLFNVKEKQALEHEML